MEILTSPILDKRINAYNVMCEMSLNEYYNLIKDSIKKNTLQRGRVHSSKSIYSLLKSDLIEGCIMPPIVLSIFSVYRNDIDNIETYIKSNKDNLIILDGLQRTFTIQEIYKEHIGHTNVLDSKIRIEIYLGLNREGVLYRMLTLNTGQTKMSLRHQIEMIYSDLISDNMIANVKFLKDSENENKKDTKTFYFNEAVDAYTSFINGSYLQITREKLLETIESFSELSYLKYKKNAFIELITVYSDFLEIANKYLNSKSREIEEFGEQEDIKPLFGKNAISIFNKSQSMTGYAAAVFRHLQLETYKDLSEISIYFEKIDEENFFEGTLNILKYLDNIRNSASKIGNSQRCLFYYIFKNLLDKSSHTFMNFEDSISCAIRNYERDF